MDALFMFGDDLEAILDVLEEDDKRQDGFMQTVSLVLEFPKNTLENVQNISANAELLHYYILCIQYIR